MDTMQSSLVDHELLDKEGNKVGKITDVIPEPKTLEPAWYTVKMNLLGRDRLVPADMVEAVDGHAVTECTKEMVKKAPSADGHSMPTGEARDELHSHYGISE